MTFGDIRRNLFRRKQIDTGNIVSKLEKCLTTFDLTALGIGSTLGLGIYVLAGKVASEKAGPAVCLSFLFAAIASIFAGLCYAEFGARVPKAGSAYIYSYVTMGEFVAFVIGWNLVLEYVIGTASVARGYSEYVDSMFNQTIQKTLTKYMPMYDENSVMSTYPDIFAFLITLSLTVMLALGVRESTRFNSIFTGINLAVVVMVIALGSTCIQTSNWTLTAAQVANATANTGVYHGEGGFAPFGFAGVMAGAATCFYGFIGFDVIASTGEEVRRPQRSIPLSIVLSLFLVFLAYFGVSSVQTLMWPYYDQSQPAPLPYIFQQAGLPTARWAISIGALSGLSTSLLGAMFPLPRILYAMALDGLLFSHLAKVSDRFHTPLLATIASGLLAGFMSLIFNIQELADMMSIGTLLAYTLVAISVLILRYSSDAHDNLAGSGDPDSMGEAFIKSSPQQQSSDSEKQPIQAINQENNRMANKKNSDTSEQPSEDLPFKLSWTVIAKQFVNKNGVKRPTSFTSKFSVTLIIVTTLMICLLDAVLAFALEPLRNGDCCATATALVLLCIVLLLIIFLSYQPRNLHQLSFQVPLVPLLPLLSVLINVYLMFNLSYHTWKRFGYWMILGLAIYFFYGYWNSNERKKRCTIAGTIESEKAEFRQIQ